MRVLEERCYCMSKENKPRSRKENIVVQEVDGEVLIYDLEKSKAFCLNQTSSLVWQACDGKRSVAQINDLLGKQLQTQTNEDIVWLALDQLSREKLIHPPVDLESKFEGMSRREVIKKVGIGSMIALPVVASLVAPTALLAQTGAPGAPLGDINTTVVMSCASQPAQDAACTVQVGATMCASMAAVATMCVDNGDSVTLTCQCA